MKLSAATGFENPFLRIKVYRTEIYLLLYPKQQWTYKQKEDFISVSKSIISVISELNFVLILQNDQSIKNIVLQR